MSDSHGIDRRAFVKAAVAIGGASALSACLDRGPELDVARGPEDPASAFPERQHAWNAALPTDDAGNNHHPRHRILLALDYDGDGTPTDAEREAVEAALTGVERAYERSADGLLLTISYSPYYFARFDADLPGSVDLPEPRALSDFEDPDADDVDAIVHLASDHGEVVMGAEEALKGEVEELNGVSQPESALTDALSVRERRTGFIGDGLPAENQDVNGVPDDGPVPEDAPLYMGFESAFEGNQPGEDRVTIESGPFAGGTTQQLSTLTLNLNQWYEQDSRDQRVSKMFCPHHASEGTVEGTGENLGNDPQMDDCGDPTETARSEGVVGHSQKMVDVREDDKPIILRRDFDSTDGDRASVHFLSLQRTIADFVTTREAMNGDAVAADSAVGQRTNNGILQYINTVRRGNFLVPPRSLRALPPSNPDSDAADTAEVARA
ncbi:Tat pathway signal protein [Halolamina litorea]|uniref:Tat pathway signal protein n=1 Tax=Halolamina litorea TaxID=1515593 RepID=A0ABD6BPC7_9EURY|nr:Tat pathway signal protein [Halolamina litorea]